MDVNDLAEFTVLKMLGLINIDSFLKAQNTYVHKQTVFNLLRIHYLINTKGTCWTKDLMNGMSQKRTNIEKRTNIAIHYMEKSRAISKHEKDKILGCRLEITNKGVFILQQYAVWLREEQKKYHYKMKQSHKESRELKEK